jgi:retron-type reverse transcriptase
MARTAKQDKVRELKRTLYRAAKADPGRRFHALYDKVHRRDVLERAWELVRANRGAAGIDRETIADVERHGVSRLLDDLVTDLKAAATDRSRPAGSSPRSPAGRKSKGRCRSRRSATASCRRL